VKKVGKPGVPAMLAAQTNLTPDAALKELLAGNGRFAANQLTSVEHDLEILKEHTADKQEPFAALLACADSRVPVELIFDQTIGHIFVARVAGNMVTPEIIATLEYGVAALGVKVVLVLGHTNCGAVKAAMKSDTVPGQISALYKHLRPAVPLS
jgi:carbonic anhydrase